jgi:peptidyl-dipeptidase A
MAGPWHAEWRAVNGSDIEEAMGTTRDPAKLKEMWVSWHDTVGTPMKADYVRMVRHRQRWRARTWLRRCGRLWRSNYVWTPMPSRR